MKPTVVVVYDSPGWSFHNIAQQLQRHLSDEYDVTICSHHEPNREALLNADAVICLWYGTVGLLHQGTDHFAPWQERIAPERCKQIACCFDEVLRWDTHTGWALEETLTFALQHSDAFLCSSDGMARRMFPFFPQPKWLGRCKDGVDLDLFPHHPYRSLAIKDGDPVNDLRDMSTPLRVGWVGNTEKFADLKGVEIIKEACQDLDGVKFVEQNKQEHGLIPHDEMHNFYGMIDVYVCMSSCEGTPNPILEASATGRAWISTDVGIVGEMNQDALSLGCGCPPGLIIPRQATVLKQALIKLRDNRGILEAMGKVGRRVVEQCWQWKGKAEQYREALHAVGVSGQSDLSETIYRQKKEPNKAPVAAPIVEPIAEPKQAISTALVFVGEDGYLDQSMVKEIQKNGASVSLCFVITKQNMLHIPRYIELASSLDCSCCLDSVTPNGDNKEFLKKAMLADHVENAGWLAKFKLHPKADRVTTWPRLTRRIDIEGRL